MIDVRCDCGAVIEVTITGRNSYTETNGNSFSVRCVELRAALAERGEISTAEFECSRMSEAVRRAISQHRT